MSADPNSPPPAASAAAATSRTRAGREDTKPRGPTGGGGLSASAPAFCFAGPRGAPARESLQQRRPGPSASAAAPCQFFLLGTCRYGGACRFSHDLPDGCETVEEARARTPCVFFLQGFCMRGDACPFRHGDGCGAGAAEAVTTGSREAVWNASAGGERGRTERGAADGDCGADYDDDRTCGICLESVPSTDGGSFGLLSCCDHRFCLPCLSQWRSTKLSAEDPDAVRRCPTCRKKSDYVVPSQTFVTGREKEVVVRRYREVLAQKPCRNFTGERGSCQFGNRCFYAHLNGRGVDVKATDKDPAEMARERRSRRWQRMGMGGRRGRFGTVLELDGSEVDDVEAIASFLALLSFYGYGFLEDSDAEDEDDSDWDDDSEGTVEEVD